MSIVCLTVVWAICIFRTWERPGIREFIKWYYPQLKKEGLVVDVRANGGGNVSRMIIERLSDAACLV